VNKSYEHLTKVKAVGGTVRIFMGQWMTASVEKITLPLSGDSLTVDMHVHGSSEQLSFVKNAYIRALLFSPVMAAKFHLLERSDWDLTDIHENFMVSPGVERWAISLTLYPEGKNE
jgi:hypothetical protein